MPKKPNKELIVGLDIGTSKVLAIVAEIGDDGDLQVIGLGHHPTSGLHRGVVVDIESTVHSIQRAVAEAEVMAGCQIMSVFVGIAGAHINSFNSNGVVGISDGAVTNSDIERVIDAAKAIAIPTDQRILHVLPQEFVIDGQDGIREPNGMCGVRLEAKVHIVTGADSAAQNIIKCVSRCGLEVDAIILEQIASSESVLSEDERQLGVCMIDIGGGTTDIAVFCEGALHHSAVIPIAGNHVTGDIAIAFHTPTKNAEEIKKKYGCTHLQLVDAAQSFEAPGRDGRAPRKLSRQNLVEVIQPRMDELLHFVQRELRRSGFEERVHAGIVLTGGCSRLEGAVALAEEIFHLPVRIGLPQYEGGKSEVVRNPIYATGIGLVLFGNANRSRLAQIASKPQRLGAALGGVSRWFRDKF